MSKPIYEISGGRRVVFPPAMVAPDGWMYITNQSAGFDITNANLYRLLGTDAMTVEVMVAPGVWVTPPPVPTPTSVGPGEIVIIKGRWEGIRVQTTGSVTFITDYATLSPAV